MEYFIDNLKEEISDLENFKSDIDILIKLADAGETVEYDMKTGESKSNGFFPLMPEDVTWRRLPMEQYNDGSNVMIYADLRDFYPGARL